jgi:hypothetical protein
MGAQTPPPAVRVPASPKTSAAALKPVPEVKTAPAALAAPVVAAPAAPAYGRVTHTKASEPGSMPASAPAVQPPAAAAKETLPGCAPAAAALGLCIAK